MKILFICGCLEPGKDGVGDYVRQLATTMARQGMNVAAISLYDFYMDSVSEESESFGDSTFSVLRIPHSFQLSGRIDLSRAKINEFNPDWLSLQFVLYSFHSKGLPFNLVYILKKIGRHRNWHLMFHELWIGMATDASKRHFMIGRLQRLFIKYLINTIKPLRISTQTRLYQEQLKNLGYEAFFLPLFSNIPNTAFKNERNNRAERKDQDKISLVVFGNIHRNAPIEQFADDAAAYTQITGRPVQLVIIGRCGREQEYWKSVWSSKGLSVDLLGEQSPENISRILSTATAGISTTPLILVEKSGAVAAMRSHALPVICVSGKWEPRGINIIQSPTSVIEYQAGNFADCIERSSHEPINIHTSLKIYNELVLNLSEINSYGKLQLSLD